MDAPQGQVLLVEVRLLKSLIKDFMMHSYANRGRNSIKKIDPINRENH